MKSEIFKNESRESSFPFSFSYPVLSKSKLNKNENSKHLKVEKCGTYKNLNFMKFLSNRGVLGI